MLGRRQRVEEAPLRDEENPLMDMNTLAATSSLAQVLLGFTMLADNCGHIAREANCGHSVAVITLASLSIAQEVMMIIFLGFMLWKTPRSQGRVKIMNWAFLGCLIVHVVFRVIIAALPKVVQDESGGRVVSDQTGQPFPPVCNCRETVRGALEELLPDAVKQAVDAAQPATATQGAQRPDQLRWLLKGIGKLAESQLINRAAARWRSANTVAASTHLQLPRHGKGSIGGVASGGGEAGRGSGTAASEDSRSARG
ncbi:uncharacterized protein LOC113651658 isoform X2 [Tachysurus fulvidraco]|uniref:uncharacterized protein LOC113651658 isoform X2 n=1 Tax=Tachysurus fulvidraco TaxID=1234273 RepID=UPI001FEEFFB3|nr:uncharacterized protein LOC113651658 isoform X2 [Tachysurus fulvidraco]